MFLCGFYKIFKNTFFTEHLRVTASAECSKLNQVCCEIWLNLSETLMNKGQDIFGKASKRSEYERKREKIKYNNRYIAR